MLTRTSRTSNINTQRRSVWKLLQSSYTTEPLSDVCNRKLEEEVWVGQGNWQKHQQNLYLPFRRIYDSSPRFSLWLSLFVPFCPWMKLFSDLPEKKRCQLLRKGDWLWLQKWQKSLSSEKKLAKLLRGLTFRRWRTAARINQDAPFEVRHIHSRRFPRGCGDELRRGSWLRRWLWRRCRVRHPKDIRGRCHRPDEVYTLQIALILCYNLQGTKCAWC